MKKYIVKFKDRGKVFGEYASKEKVFTKLMEFINVMNKGLGVDYFSPFDFVIEEVECKEVNEEITDFGNARKALDIESNSDFVSENIAYVARFVKEINPKHIEALIALNQLFTIADAWNKSDGFVPDFSDFDKEKWFPWFNYDNDTERFVYTATNLAPANVGAPFGSRICFKTSERAKQFGKQFEELYNKVFL